MATRLFDKEKMIARLKELRQSKDWSLLELGEMLKNRLPEMNLEGENGKQTVSQLERGSRKPTIEIAFAYADIFNVTIDYVYGWSDDFKPEYKGTKELTGLNDDAISSLIELNSYDEIGGMNRAIHNKRIRDVLNMLLVAEKKFGILEAIADYFTVDAMPPLPNGETMFVNPESGLQIKISSNSIYGAYLLSIQEQISKLRLSLRNGGAQ